MLKFNRFIIQAIFVLSVGAYVHAATLRESLYMALPWGTGPAEVARWVPKPQDEDQELGGPVDFAIGPDGAVALISNVDTSLKLFTSSGTLLQSLPFNRGDPDRLEGIAWNAAGQLALVGGFGSWPRNSLEQLRLFDQTLHPADTINLTALGIHSALDVEWGADGNVFIQNNRDFKTWELRLPDHVVKKVDDDHLAWLCGQGRYQFEFSAGRMKVYSGIGRLVADYPDDGKNLRFIGVNSAGVLYVLFRNPQKGLFLENVTSEGVKTFSILVSDSHAQALLDPDRAHDLRNWRVGFDGAVYATGDPTDDQFRIYRFSVKE